MAVITDLTVQQLQDQLPTGSFTVTGGNVVLNVGVATGSTVDALTDKDVVKLINILLDAGYKAQVAANTNQVAGERLAAFGAPTYGANANGYAPVTRTFVSRAQLTSATSIIGQVA